MKTASDMYLFGLGFLSSYGCSFCGSSALELLGLGFPMIKRLAGEYEGGLGWLAWWTLNDYDLIFWFSKSIEITSPSIKS